MSVTTYEVLVNSLREATEAEKDRLRSYVAGYRFNFLVECLMKQGMDEIWAVNEALIQELRSLRK